MAPDFFDGVAAGSTALFTGLFFFHILKTRRTGVRVNTLGYRKKGLLRMIEVLVPWLSLLLLLEIGLHAARASWHVVRPQGYPSWFELPMLRWLGVACLAGSCVWVYQALRDLGDSYRLGVDRHHPGALMTRGLFAYSRNPIYLGIWVFLLGQFLVYPNSFFFWMMLGSAGFFHYLIRREEAGLRHLHGSAFDDYAARVSRYIGCTRHRPEVKS